MHASDGISAPIQASIAARLFVASVAVAVASDGDLAKGKDVGANSKAACATCHGSNGEGQPAAGIPRLAGLSVTYLDRQLTAFGAGTRANAIMSPIARTMNTATMADAAAYYASLPVPVPCGATPKPTGQNRTGETLALRGDWTANVPPCASCHGKNGLGVGSTFPPIAGQSATYIASQFKAWRAGTRKGDPLGLMTSLAGRLDDKQIADVAAYYETLPWSLAGTAAGSAVPTGGAK